MSYRWPDLMRAIALLLLLTGIGGPGVGAASELVLTYLGASSTPLENPHDLKLSPDG